MPAIEQVDAEKLLTDWLFTLVSGTDVPGVSGWSVGTTIKPGTTPTNAIRVRTVGGVEEQRVADRPRLDVRLWGDGSYLTEGAVKRNARAIVARIRRDFRTTSVLDPIALPDPADTTKTHILFTVELLTRGTQV
jgi:hypothetical protein